MITSLQILVFVVYISIVVIKFNVPKSISSTAYLFKGDDKYYFMLMCWLIGALNLFQNMEGWGFLMTAGLLFTGITVNYRENIAHSAYIHSIGAITAILSGFIGLWVLHNIWIPFAVFIIIATLTLNKPNKMWWIEIEAFMLILIGYLIK